MKKQQGSRVPMVVISNNQRDMIERFARSGMGCVEIACEVGVINENQVRNVCKEMGVPIKIQRGGVNEEPNPDPDTLVHVPGREPWHFGFDLEPDAAMRLRYVRRLHHGKYANLIKE